MRARTSCSRPALCEKWRASCGRYWLSRPGTSRLTNRICTAAPRPTLTGESRSFILNTCLENERASQMKLDRVWNEVPPDIKTVCGKQMDAFKDGSYLLLSICVVSEVGGKRWLDNGGAIQLRAGLRGISDRGCCWADVRLLRHGVSVFGEQLGDEISVPFSASVAIRSRVEASHINRLGSGLPLLPHEVLVSDGKTRHDQLFQEGRCRA